MTRFVRFFRHLPAYPRRGARSLPAAHPRPTLRPLPPVPGLLIAWAFVALGGALGSAPALVAQTPAGSTSWIIEEGQAQVVPAFADSTRWIRQQLWVETPVDLDGDGRLDRVHVTVVRPAAAETAGLRVPVVYETSPYYAGTANVREILWNVEQELGAAPPPRGAPPQVAFRPDRDRISNSHVGQWVPRGFAVVHSESPGTGLSQGCPTMGGENESLAPAAVVDWLNGRARGFTTPTGMDEVRADWASGAVGMTGTSFNGTLPLAAATTGVEGLRAIIPIAPNTSYWHYYRSHGLIRSPGGYLGEDIDSLYDYVYSGNPERREFCNSTVRADMLARMDRVEGNWSDFWAERDYALQLDRLTAAVLMAHAWNDWNVMPEHSVRVIEGLKARGTPLQMYFHQGGHGGAPPFEMMNRWFTRYLLDVENGVEQDPAAWIVREGADRLEPTPYADYPHPEAAPVPLHPRGSGRGMGSLALTPLGAGATSGDAERFQTVTDDVRAGTGTDLAQAETSVHRLLFATEELAEAVHLSGTAELTVRLSASAPRVNLSAWLVQLPWEAPEPRQPNFNIITRGWADPTNARSLTATELLTPGEFRTVTFTLQPDDQIIPAGKRIALVLFSSDAEFTLWPAAGTEVTFDLGGIALTLPVVGGEAALHRALGHEPPSH
jgi:X-Pro dipeptidyl-peptidase